VYHALRQFRIPREESVLPLHLATERRESALSDLAFCRIAQMPDINVRYQGQPGKHMLALSFSQFDPRQNSQPADWLVAIISRNCAKS
jgi:hypothetical protein